MATVADFGGNAEIAPPLGVGALQKNIAHCVLFAARSPPAFQAPPPFASGADAPIDSNSGAPNPVRCSIWQVRYGAHRPAHWSLKSFHTNCLMLADGSLMDGEGSAKKSCSPAGKSRCLQDLTHEELSSG
jgi:hypothetical protein